MAHTIPDLKAHDLSPAARVQVYRKNTQVVGYRKILARVKGMFSLSGMTYYQMQHLSKSRTGRRELARLVYRAVYDHYRHEACRNHSYSCARARNARRSFKVELRKLGATLNMRETYTYDALKMKPRKDTTSPMDSFYIPVKDTPAVAITSAIGCGNVTHYRKPGGGDIFCKAQGQTVSVDYAKKDIQCTDTIKYPADVNTLQLWDVIPDTE